MKQTIGRFLLQPNKNFPIDCETMDAMQTNIALLQVLGNIAGNKTILSGCEPEQNGTRRKAGYVFVKTKDFPEGEVLYWEGGNVSGGMYVNQEVVQVTAQGYEFPQAYTVRSLVAGVGSENFSWSDFKTFKTPRELEEYDKTQDAKIALLAPPPLGIVQIWAGKVVPSGYELCEGQQLKISEYPALYAAIGSTYNSAFSYTGSRYSTMSGYFRLPDLRGRFLVGYNASDGDYNAYGRIGGEKKHALTTSEMPSHSHNVRDYYYIEAYSSGGMSGNEYVGGSRSGSAKTDNDNNYLYYRNHNTDSAGSGYSHENRPPYYSLAYIMRTK